MIPRFIDWRPRAALACAAVLTSIIAFCDWRLEINATLGFLYIFPMVLLGTAFRWWQVLIAAGFCTLLSDRLDPFPMEMEWARDVLISLTMAVTGLLSLTVTRSYRRERDRLAAQLAAEEQLKFFADTSPAAMLTMNPDGEILLANPAAHRLLAVAEGQLPGRNIKRYVPALASVPSVGGSARIFRTEMQTHGQRQNGEAFLADVFFSTYLTDAGARLAALLVDTSERLREREEANFQQLLTGSRIAVAAVSHEVRNVCGAIRMMHENLMRKSSLKGDQDFEALGSLVDALSKIASLELKHNVSETGSLDLVELLSDVRIVLEPICEESEIELRWQVPPNLPLVRGDRHSLMQVFLNLAKNSQRALERVESRIIEVVAAASPDQVLIRFSDSGPGLPPGQRLFQPLQKGAEDNGLGLYLSRAFMRSFNGELRHDPQAAGCSFVLAFTRMGEPRPEASSTEHAAPPALTA